MQRKRCVAQLRPGFLTVAQCSAIPQQDREAAETNGYGCCPFFFRPKSLCTPAWRANGLRWQQVAWARDLPCPPVTRVVSAMTRATVARLWPALSTRGALVRSSGALHDAKLGVLLPVVIPQKTFLD